MEQIVRQPPVHLIQSNLDRSREEFCGLLCRLPGRKETEMAEADKNIEQKKKECLRKCGVLLAQRDYTCSRLREKLLGAGFSEEVVEMTLESLREANYLNDERYAQNYVQAHWEDRSRLRIRMDLETRGVPSEIISEVIRAQSEERGPEAEIRQIRKLMNKRKYDPEEATWEERQKMQAYLYRKGYRQSSVRAAEASESLDSDEFSV